MGIITTLLIHLQATRQLSGIVHGDTVTCPLHGWKLGLADGQAVAPDKGCSKPFAVKIDGGEVWLRLD